MADWVVVGAGSAGCVVTRRLVDAGRSVVLVEAGPTLPDPLPPSFDSDDPFALHSDPRRIAIDITATRTTESARRRYLRGRGLGGSSVVNAMVALHCDPELPASWGWTGWADAVERVELPVAPARPDEFGVVDRALLDAAPGSEPVALTRREGRRVSSAEAYLSPVLTSSSLTVLTDVAVAEIVVDGGVAIGVRLADGRSIEADGVALCGGAIESPALLQRSGLGGAGVGVGLQDHPSVAVTIELADPTEPDGLAMSVIGRRDPWQLLPINHFGHASDGRYAALMVALMRPIGRSGTVSAGPAGGPPVVDLDLLTHPDDRRAMRRGLQQLIDVVHHDAFREIATAVYIDDHGTPLERLIGADVDAVESWILTHVGDYVHASSSTAGALGDAGAVTGVSGLFVADASAFPSIPDVNTHLPTTVLAELFVDRWIRDDGT